MCTTIDLKMFARVTKDRQLQSLVYTRGLAIDLYCIINSRKFFRVKIDSIELKALIINRCDNKLF